jgi:hypothetical protein
MPMTRHAMTYIAIAWSFALVPAVPTASYAQTGPSAAICTVEEVERKPLVLHDGAEAYVAPHTAVAGAAGDIFLAGTPNYIFRRDTAGRGTLVGRDSILGVLIVSDGTAHAVPTPVGPHLATRVNAAGRVDGTWDIVFAEKHVPGVDAPETPPIRISRLWHGVWSRTEGWTSLREIPRPGNVEITTLRSGVSELARGNGRLAWAVGARSQSGPDGVLVLEWTPAAGWRHELVPTSGFASVEVVYPDTTSKLFLAYIAADTALEPGTTDTNSLFVLTRDPQWGAVRRVVHGASDGPVYDASLGQWGSRMLLTWGVGHPAGAAVRAADPSSSESAYTVAQDRDPEIEFSAFPLSGATYAWVTLRRTQPGMFAPGELYLRTEDGLRAPAPVSIPALASFKAVSAPDQSFVIAGAHALDDAGIVVTLLIRYRVACNG